MTTNHSARRQATRRSDSGFGAVELVIAVPFLLIGMMLLQLGWTVTSSNSDVAFAATSGARAAARAETPDGARSEAERGVLDVVRERAVPCRAPVVVDVNTNNFGPDGSVRVTVTCTADLSRLSLLHVPGTRTSTRSAVAVVDRLRGGE